MQGKSLIASAIAFGIACFSSAATGVFKDFPLSTPNGAPNAIGLGANGDIIYTATASNRIGRLWTDGTVVEYSIPTPNAGPSGLTSDVGGNIWFTEYQANKIGRLSPSGVITEFSVPTPGSGPLGIALIFQGVWFTEFLAGKIAKVSQDGLITEYSLSGPASGPTAITSFDSGPSIVFTEQIANRIGRLLPDGSIVETPIPTPSSRPMDITQDTTGNLWFTEFVGNKIGRIDPNFVISEYPLPNPGSGPRGIAARAFAGEVWFTEELGNRIGRLSSDGSIAEFPIPTADSHPTAITSAATNLNPYFWFAEQSGHRISRVIEDVLVLPIGGKAGKWYSRIDLASTESQSSSIFVGAKPTQVYEISPVTIGIPLCSYQEMYLSLPPNGSLSDAQAACPFFSTIFINPRQRGVLPSARARVFNTMNPSQATDLPVTRLSRIAELDPQVLVFPVSASPGAEVNLFLSDVSQLDNLSVSIEAYSTRGELLGSRTATTSAGSGMILPALQLLGLSDLEGQLRVTKISGTGWMWGTLITASPDGTLSATLGVNP